MDKVRKTSLYLRVKKAYIESLKTQKVVSMCKYRKSIELLENSIYLLMHSSNELNINNLHDLIENNDGFMSKAVFGFEITHSNETDAGVLSYFLLTEDFKDLDEIRFIIETI